MDADRVPSGSAGSETPESGDGQAVRTPSVQDEETVPHGESLLNDLDGTLQSPCDENVGPGPEDKQFKRTLVTPSAGTTIDIRDDKITISMTLNHSVTRPEANSMSSFVAGDGNSFNSPDVSSVDGKCKVLNNVVKFTDDANNLNFEQGVWVSGHASSKNVPRIIIDGKSEKYSLHPLKIVVDVEGPQQIAQDMNNSSSNGTLEVDDKEAGVQSPSESPELVVSVEKWSAAITDKNNVFDPANEVNILSKKELNVLPTKELNISSKIELHISPTRELNIATSGPCVKIKVPVINCDRATVAQNLALLGISKEEVISSARQIAARIDSGETIQEVPEILKRSAENVDRRMSSNPCLASTSAGASSRREIETKSASVVDISPARFSFKSGHLKPSRSNNEVSSERAAAGEAAAGVIVPEEENHRNEDAGEPLVQEGAALNCGNPNHLRAEVHDCDDLIGGCLVRPCPSMLPQRRIFAKGCVVAGFMLSVGFLGIMIWITRY